MTQAESLAIGTLIVYVILVQPTIYCLWKHGKRGLLGWLYLQLFCVIRIIGNALQLHADATNSSGTTSLIISNVGLSPLLLATAGILHEARVARNPNIRSKFEWFIVINYHGLVSVSLALIVAGVVFLENKNTGSKTQALIKLGIALVLMCWVLLCSWTAISFLPQQRDVNAVVFYEGTQLLYGVSIALPLIALRLIYGVVSLIIESPNPTAALTSEFTTSLAVKVCLSTIPEMILTAVFIRVGISTANMWTPLGAWKRVRSHNDVEMESRKFLRRGGAV